MKSTSAYAALTLLAALAVSQAAPRAIILDTDMGNDMDDVQALALIHSLQNRGVLELIAVTSTKDHPLSAPFIDAVNTFYGRPDIPVGAARGGVTPDEGKYLGLLRRTYDAGKPWFPHDLTNLPDAVALLRKTLASRPEGSVSIAQVGFFTNLLRLAESPPDEISPLAGEELVRRKVSQLVIMAGAFDTAGEFKDHREYNVVKDIPSARGLAEKWPGTIVWSGFEIGMALRFPAVSIRQDYSYEPSHIVRESYLAYCGENTENPTWDLTCPLFIAFPDRGYLDLSEAGAVKVGEDGLTVFHPQAGGHHRFLRINAAQAERVREAFVWLCSEPSAKSTTRDR